LKTKTGSHFTVPSYDFRRLFDNTYGKIANMIIVTIGDIFKMFLIKKTNGCFPR